MPVLIDSVTFADVLGHHTISIEKVDVRTIDPATRVPKSVEAFLYFVTERHDYTFTEVHPTTGVSMVATTTKTVRAEFLTEEKAREHFQHVYREQDGKETITGVTRFSVKSVGNTGKVSVLISGTTEKVIVMTGQCLRALHKLTEDATIFDAEFLYYTNTSTADDVVVTVK